MKNRKGFIAVAVCVQKSRETKERKAGFVHRACLRLANNQTAHRSWLVGRLTQSQPAERLVKQQSRAGDQGDLHSRALRPAFLCNEDIQRALFLKLRYSFQITRRCRHSSKKKEKEKNMQRFVKELQCQLAEPSSLRTTSNFCSGAAGERRWLGSSGEPLRSGLNVNS